MMAPARQPSAVLRTAELEAGLQLLRLAEIVVHAFAQRRAVQLDDALVAVGVLALVDGEGEIAGAEQARHRRPAPRCDIAATLVGVELGIAAHRALAGDVGHHQLDRPVALGLQGEDALVFEGAGERRRQRHHLGQQLGDAVRDRRAG